MRRIAPLPLVAAALLATGRPAAGCTFCGGVAGRQTLREHFARARWVAAGRLENPRFDPAGGPGATDFRVGRVLKPDRAADGRPVVAITQYLPVVGDTPPDYLVFGSPADGKLDPSHGVSATAAVVDYLVGAAKLADADAAGRLGYFFRHLDSPDPVVAADAYLEFAKAPDAEVAKARAVLDPVKLRALLTNPGTPADRAGVFALLLGLCGGPADARLLAGLLDRRPLPDPVKENLGGFLAGLTLADPAAGWRRTEALLGGPDTPFDQRLAAVGTVRFFQATRPAEARRQVVRCYRGALAQGELADVATDDLRRWGWWDLTAEVLAAYDRPGQGAVVRRAVVGYALRCPGEEGKRLVARARAADPKLVAAVEETLQLFDPK